MQMYGNITVKQIKKVVPFLKRTTFYGLFLYSDAGIYGKQSAFGCY